MQIIVKWRYIKDARFATRHGSDWRKVSIQLLNSLTNVCGLIVRVQTL